METRRESDAEGRRRIFYCHCAYARIIPQQVKMGVLRGLASSGVAFEAVADLCESSARRDPALRRLVSGSGEIRIAACYPRAVRWLFHAAGVPLPLEAVKILNMRIAKATDILEELLGECGPEAAAEQAGSDRDTHGASSGTALPRTQVKPPEEVG